MRKIKFTKKLAWQWIDALRSGEYKQGKFRLESKEGFCCLGVLCKILNTELLNLEGRLAGRTPQFQDIFISGILDCNGYLKSKTYGTISLTNLNDLGLTQAMIKNLELENSAPLNPFTFDEIADIIYLVAIEGV